MSQVQRRYLNLTLRQSARNLIRAVSVQGHSGYLAYHVSSFFAHNPVFPFFVRADQVLAALLF